MDDHMESHGFYQQFSSSAFRKADVEVRKKLLVHPGQHAVDVAC